MGQLRGNLLLAIGVIAIGALGLSQSLGNLSGSSSATVGPGFVPAIISSLIVVIGLALAVSAYATAPIEGGASGRDAMAELVQVALCVGLGAAYMALFGWVGYFVATAIALCLALLVFGNRGAMRLGFLSVGGAVAYYLAFVGVLSIYDPADMLGPLLEAAGF